MTTASDRSSSVVAGIARRSSSVGPRASRDTSIRRTSFASDPPTTLRIVPFGFSVDMP